MRGQVWSYDEQVPPTDSPLGKTLERIYRRYDGNYKHGFQALAAITARRVIAGPGLSYHEGWVTPVGPDGGVDFVQRLDVGSEMASTKLVVLGQAKCKKPWPRSGNGISAEELARVVARLRRGWIGAYVTTTFFTDSAQKELLVDKYPVVQIAGLRLAQTAEEMRDELGLPTIDAFLDWVDGEYVRMLRSARARPSDITRELPSRIDVPDASNDRPAREQRAAGVSPNPSGLGTP